MRGDGRGWAAASGTLLAPPRRVPSDSLRPPVPPSVLPPADLPTLLRRSTTWDPGPPGIPRHVMRQARQQAAEIARTVGRRNAIAHYLLARAACDAGWMSLIARVPLFQTPGILLADPHREALYWCLDPGLPRGSEEGARSRLAGLLRQAREQETGSVL